MKLFFVNETQLRTIYMERLQRIISLELKFKTHFAHSLLMVSLSHQRMFELKLNNAHVAMKLSAKKAKRRGTKEKNVVVASYAFFHGKL